MSYGCAIQDDNNDGANLEHSLISFYDEISNVSTNNHQTYTEPRNEKTDISHMRKQRRSSASQ